MGETYSEYALHKRGGDGQLRTHIVQVVGILTRTKVLPWSPEVLVINGRVMGQETGERYYTFMKAKDNCMYIRAASIARKYNVASATIVRTKADSLSALLLRYAHQTMTRNADRSGCSPHDQRFWRQQLERAQLLTIRGANRI